MSILLTGANGFIGSYVLEKLLDTGENVVVLRRKSSDLWRIESLLHRCTLVEEENLFDPDFAKSLNVNYIIHLATFYEKKHSSSSIEKMIQSNIELPLKLLEIFSKMELKGFINTGSFFEYDLSKGYITEETPNGIFNLYSTFKTSFEDFLKYYQRSFGFNALTLKIFSPYGPRDTSPKVLPYVIRNINSGTNIEFANPFESLSWIYVEDVANAYVKALNWMRLQSVNPSYEVFNICSEESHNVFELMNLINSLIQNPVEFTYSSRSETRFLASNEKSKAKLGWYPENNIVDGLKKLLIANNVSLK